MLFNTNREYRCRAFRCFTIFDCNTQQQIILIKRQCGALFENTMPKVKEHVQRNIMDSQRFQILVSSGDRCEWHGILDENTNCYFLMMTFPSSQQAYIKSSLMELKQIVQGLSNYQKYTDSSFPQGLRNQLTQKLEDLEFKYVNEYGTEGQPNSSEIGETNRLLQKGGNEQFLESTPQIQQKKSGFNSKLSEPYSKFSIYRCFYIYDLKENKNLFIVKRGCSKSFEATIDNLINYLRSQINETTKFEVYMKGNARSEWHGILDDQKQCYFLLMTFPSTQKDNVKESLQELKKMFQDIPNYDKLQYHQLEQKIGVKVGNMIDYLEVKYFNMNGNEGFPSDSEIQRQFVSSVQFQTSYFPKPGDSTPQFQSHSNLLNQNQTWKDKCLQNGKYFICFGCVFLVFIIIVILLKLF